MMVMAMMTKTTIVIEGRGEGVRLTHIIAAARAAMIFLTLQQVKHGAASS